MYVNGENNSGLIRVVYMPTSLVLAVEKITHEKATKQSWCNLFFMLACNILTMVIRGDKHTTNTLISNHRSRWLLHQSVGRFYSRNGQQRATLLSTRSHGDVHEQNKSKHTHTRTPLLSPFSCVDL
jgi:hypothetical protein